MTNKKVNTGTTAPTENNGTDNTNMMTMLEVISGFKTDITELNPAQTAFINSQDDDVKPIAKTLCISGNKRQYSEVDFMFSIYAYHVARYEKSKCSVQSTLSTLPDMFGISGEKTDVENMRKTFHAFSKFFTSPENVKVFRMFGITKLRILSMVYDSNVSKVIDMIAEGTLRPDITVSNLRDVVKKVNGTTNKIDFDIKDEKTEEKKTEEKKTEEKKTEENKTEKKKKTEEKKNNNSVLKPETITDVCDDSEKYENALELATKYIRYMTDYTSLANIFDDIRNKLS